MTTAECGRDLSVNKRQRIVRPLVREERRFAVHGDLEAALRAVVDHGRNRRRRYIADADARLDGIGRRVAGGKRFFKRFIELRVVDQSFGHVVSLSDVQ